MDRYSAYCPWHYLHLAALASPILLHQAEADLNCPQINRLFANWKFSFGGSSTAMKLSIEPSC